MFYRVTHPFPFPVFDGMGVLTRSTQQSFWCLILLKEWGGARGPILNMPFLGSAIT